MTQKLNVAVAQAVGYTEAFGVQWGDVPAPLDQTAHDSVFCYTQC